jgi:hypothetical protein
MGTGILNFDRRALSVLGNSLSATVYTWKVILLSVSLYAAAARRILVALRMISAKPQ